MMLSGNNKQKYGLGANSLRWPHVFLAGMFLAGMSLVSCDRTRNDKGYEYFPDMAHSLAYETYSPNTNYPDGKTEHPPVKGTIPREMIPYPYPATQEGRTQAGLELITPLNDSLLNLETGKNFFTTYCIVCHGPAGDGKGHLFTSGKYTIPPASLLSDKMRAVPDGEIYHVITVGYNVMGAYGPQIRPDDRWQIVNYVRKVLQKKLNK